PAEDLDVVYDARRVLGLVGAARDGEREQDVLRHACRDCNGETTARRAGNRARSRRYRHVGRLQLALPPPVLCGPYPTHYLRQVTVTRREFAGGALAAAVLGCARPTSRPKVTHGVQAGDVQAGSAVVWARCDEPARMLVEWDTSERFGNARRIAGPL